MKTTKRQIYSVIDGHHSFSVSDRRRIVILGKTGTGKSSLANTIFGEDAFKIYHNLKSGTRECEVETRSVNGRSVTLVDTPGFFDTDRSEEELKPEIVRCITECAPGPHAFLIVLKVERFTEQEQEVIHKIQEYFSEEALKYATVVFTHGDQLPEEETIEELVRKVKILSELVKKCGGRCHVVDNKYWKDKPMNEYRSNQFQVEELLKTIDKMVTENNGGCYTNEMLQKVEEKIQQEEENIRQSPGNMTEEQIRGEAKVRVFDWLLIRLAGVGTGALLGAFLGVVVMGGLVVIGLKTMKPLAKLVTAAATAAKEFGAAAGGAAAAGAAAAEGGAATGGAAVGGAAAAAAGAAAAEGGAATGGAAVVGAAVVGAAGGGGAAAGIISIAKTSAVAGAVIGGVTGFVVAEGAETPQEAAKMAAEAVKNEALYVLDLANDLVEKILPSK